MIDIHAHILPNIDDGARSASETFDMINEASKRGITDIIATSHYMKDRYEIETQDREKIIDLINRKLVEKSINVKIHNGAEIMIYPEICKDLKKGKIPSLANSKYILFEIPTIGKIIYLDDIIRELQENGYKLVMAHPERYQIVKEEPEIVDKCINKGILLQGDISSIVGDYGERAKKTLKKLLKSDKITFLATDTHQRYTRYQDLEEHLKLIQKEIKIEKLEELTIVNPMKIIH